MTPPSAKNHANAFVRKDVRRLPQFGHVFAPVLCSLPHSLHFTIAIIQIPRRVGASSAGVAACRVAGSLATFSNKLPKLPQLFQTVLNLDCATPRCSNPHHPNTRLMMPAENISPVPPRAPPSANRAAVCCLGGRVRRDSVRGRDRGWRYGACRHAAPAPDGCRLPSLRP